MEGTRSCRQAGRQFAGRQAGRQAHSVFIVRIVKLSAVKFSPFWQDFGENGEAFFQRNFIS
jgi:hypothetical protein